MAASVLASPPITASSSGSSPRTLSSQVATPSRSGTVGVRAAERLTQTLTPISSSGLPLASSTLSSSPQIACAVPSLSASLVFSGIDSAAVLGPAVGVHLRLWLACSLGVPLACVAAVDSTAVPAAAPVNAVTGTCAPTGSPAGGRALLLRGLLGASSSGAASTGVNVSLSVGVASSSASALQALLTASLGASGGGTPAVSAQGSLADFIQSAAAASGGSPADVTVIAAAGGGGSSSGGSASAGSAPSASGGMSAAAIAGATVACVLVFLLALALLLCVLLRARRAEKASAGGDLPAWGPALAAAAAKEKEDSGVLAGKDNPMHARGRLSAKQAVAAGSDSRDQTVTIRPEPANASAQQMAGQLNPLRRPAASSR